MADMNADCRTLAHEGARIDAIVLAAIDTQVAGKPIDIEQFAAKHPDIADDIRIRLNEVAQIELMATRPDLIPDRTDFDVDFDDDIVVDGDLDLILEKDDEAVEDLPQPSIDNYSIHGIIGRGGQSIVYAATQDSIGKPVAIKYLRANPLTTSQQLSRFRLEIDILANLKHNNIVSIIDGGSLKDGSLYLIMERVEGLPLDRWIARNFLTAKELSDAQPQLLAIFIKIAKAVQYAHTQGVIHRDLKPSNIIIDERGEPYLVDFGLARRNRIELAGRQSLTVAGQFLGSIFWASPEQLNEGAQKVDLRTDVYSLGLLLYLMLTNSFPFNIAVGFAEALRNVMSTTPMSANAAIASTNKGENRRHWLRWKKGPIDRKLEAIIYKSIQRSADRRYQSAEALAADVSAFVTGQRVSAVTARFRRKQVWATAGLLLLLLMTGSILPMTEPFTRQSPIEAAANRMATRKPISAVNFNGHSYAVINTEFTFDDARRKAQALGGDLIVIESRTEHLFLCSLLGHGTNMRTRGRYWWLGIESDGTNHRDIFGKSLTYESWPPKGLKDPPGEYVGYTTGYRWMLSPRTTTAFVIVEWDTPTSTSIARAELPQNAVVVGDFAYALIPDRLWWSYALLAASDRGGRLAVFPTPEHEQIVREKLLSESDLEEGVWLGASSFGEDISLSDGTTTAYSGALIPGSCGVLTTSGVGFTLNGEIEKKAWICQWDLR